MGGWEEDSKEDYSKMKVCQGRGANSEVQQLRKMPLSACLWFVLWVFEWRAEGMFWWLSAYWQACDVNANGRSNLATSLFTLGIKLKNTASNFIPGFLHHHSQCDIYSLAWCPFSLPLPLTPSFSLLIDKTVCSKQGRSGKWCQLYTEWKYICLLTMKSFPFPHTWRVNYFPASRDK